MQEMAREQKSLLFFPASAPDSSPDIASPLQQQLLSPCMAVEGPGHTKSSTPLEFSCWDITPCSLAALKQLPAKLYPACPQLQGSEQHLLSQPQTSALSMGQGKVGSSKITRNQQEREVFRVDLMPCSAHHKDLGSPRSSRAVVLGKFMGLFPAGAAAGGVCRTGICSLSWALGLGTAERAGIPWQAGKWDGKCPLGALGASAPAQNKDKHQGQAALGSLTAFGSPKLTLLLHGLQFWLSRALSSSSHDTLLPLLSLGLIPAGFISVPAV